LDGPDIEHLIGRTRHVSRDEILQNQRFAEARKLYLDARGGHRVEILPRLWASYDRGIAGGMYLHDLVYGVATGRRSAQ